MTYHIIYLVNLVNLVNNHRNFVIYQKYSLTLRI